MISSSTRRPLVALVAALTLLGTTAVAPPAFADAESDAKDLFARGRELRGRGDCAGAAPLFRKAWRVYPQGLGSLRNLAECEEALGHFASSRRAWLDLKRALVTAPNDPKYEGWDKDADDAAARIKPKVALVTIDVIVRTDESEGPANERSGVEVLVNGEAIAPNLLGTPLDRDPGTYRIRVQARDAQPVEQSVVLVAGDSKNVSLRIVRHAADASAAGAPASGTGDTAGPPRPMQKTLGYVAVGVGGAALVGSLVTFLLRQGALDDLEAACGPDYENTCPRSKEAERNDAVDRGDLMSVLSPVLLGVGVVGVGTGVALIVTAPKRSGALGSASGLRVAPGLGRIDLSVRF